MVYKKKSPNISVITVSIIVLNLPVKIRVSDWIQTKIPLYSVYKL